MKLKISERIYRCRKEKDMTQEELAAALDVTPQAVFQLGEGRISRYHPAARSGESVRHNH